MDDRPLAASIGLRLRAARRRAGLTQQVLAGERYTKAYISALETGVAKPSMAALNYLAGRLGMPASAFIADTETAWTRLDADLQLAQSDFAAAADGYGDLLAAEPNRADRAGLLAGLAEALVRLDRGAEAIRAASESIAIYEELGRPAERINAQYWLASGHHAVDNEDEARSLLREILDATRADDPPDPMQRVRILIALGIVEMGAGRSEAAVAYLREADGLSGELDIRRQATFLYAIATAYRRAGDQEAAIRAGTQSLALFKSAEAGIELAGIANHLALAYLDSGSRDRAAEMARLGRASAIKASDSRLLAHIADTQARIELAGGDLATASRHADEAIALSRRTENRPALLDAMVTKARILLDGDDALAATALLAEAADIVCTSGPVGRRKDVLSAWADALARSGDHARAYEVMREAVQPAR
ncbi:MAG TPA: helix-turn-helix domain-containing protein [Candidatus Limnocylindrales bacterium]